MIEVIPIEINTRIGVLIINAKVLFDNIEMIKNSWKIVDDNRTNVRSKIESNGGNKESTSIKRRCLKQKER